jgi:hypothetical protein
MIKNTILLLLATITMQAFAQKTYRYLKTPVELSTIDFGTFNAANFYSEAGNVIYKKPVSGFTDTTVLAIYTAPMWKAWEIKPPPLAMLAFMP